MRTIAILCVVLAAFYTYSEACRCETKHPQKQFCEADFGMYFWDFFFFYKFTDLVIIYLLKNIKYIFQKNNRNLPYKIFCTLFCYLIKPSLNKLKIFEINVSWIFKTYIELHAFVFRSLNAEDMIRILKTAEIWNRCSQC